MSKEHYYNLSQEILCKILDNIYHEIYVTDANFNILYVNDSCYRHYGLKAEEMIGHNHDEFHGHYWYPSVLPMVHKEKRRMCIEQITITGEKIITTSVPVLNNSNEVAMVVSIVQEDMNSLNMGVDPNLDGDCRLWVQRSAQVNSFTSDIITRSPAMNNLLTLSKKAALSDISVLISGASGTGKGMLAKYIHEHSPRSKFPFLTINCAAIPENLLESELFGHAPYAFTGANLKGKMGLIELAEGGTLFLDELAELAPALQAKLLHVVEHNQYMKVGGKEVKNSNVRIISATNQSLEDLVQKNIFREDLFWRLNVIDFKIPSLAERKEDIIPLSSYYLNQYNKKYKNNKSISKEAFRILLDYQWPGNVRQLRNVIERAFVLSPKPEITAEDLPILLQNKAKKEETQTASDFNGQMLTLERQFILRLCAKHKSSRKLASVLDISQSQANRLMQKYLITE